jgi:hypothetical protein
MLTIFTTAKPFRGHIGMIQHNALKSWTLLHPDIQIILFGDDEGAAEACAALGLQHEPYVARTRFGATRLDYMFGKAQEMARHELCCYANCDIILLADFLAALQRTASSYQPFLMVGRRWDVENTAPLAFTSPGWQEQLVAKVRAYGKRRTPDWIDYFAFSRGVYADGMPPLGIGRLFWDNWLVWKALAAKVMVVDATEVVLAVHQNHDYAHHSGAAKGVWFGEEQRENFLLIGGHGHLRTIASARVRLTAKGLVGNPLRHVNYWARRTKRGAITAVTKVQTGVWHPLLNLTRPVRRALGMRKRSL